MSGTAEIEREIKVIAGLQDLHTANEELAVVRMQQIRRSVLSTRAFMDEIIDVFRDVRTSQAGNLDRFYGERQQGWLLRQASRFAREDEDESVGAHAKKQSAAVLLSANDRLSGEIVVQVFEKFIAHVKGAKSHPIILGRVGKNMYDESGVGETPHFFELPDDRDITLSDIRPLVDTLRTYGDVMVFYARFINLVKQVPNASLLAESALQEAERRDSEGTPDGGGGRATSYVFEPSLEQVVDIFDSQILTVLVTQIATEAQLGLLGSRVTTLERSQQLIETYLDKLEKKKIRTRRVEANEEQRERLAGISLWTVGG